MTLDHTQCKFSSDILGYVTAGQGDLDWNGEWQIPCEECRARMSKAIKEFA